MKKTLFIGMALVLTVLLSASMLVAQEKVALDKEKATCQKEMKLTDEQKAKVEELKMDHRLKTIDLKAEQQKLGIMLKKEMTKDEPSMQEIEGIIKKMSTVREKLQLAAIEHALAMRKLLGPEWAALMRSGRGEGCEMTCGAEMAGACEGDEGMPMCASMRPMARMQKMGAAKEGCMMMKKGAAGHMEAGCMMKQGARGAGRGMGEMKGGCMMMQKGGACCSDMRGSYRHKMFRPFGKKSCCSEMGGMRGCFKESSCMKEGVRKEVKYKVEIKEEKKN